jgi:hypothetical protein
MNEFTYIFTYVFQIWQSVLFGNANVTNNTSLWALSKVKKNYSLQDHVGPPNSQLVSQSTSVPVCLSTCSFLT